MFPFYATCQYGNNVHALSSFAEDKDMNVRVFRGKNQGKLNGI